MSWSIKSIGEVQDVLTEVGAITLPEHIKASILDVLQQPHYGYHNGVIVEGSGHDGHSAWINSLKIERVSIAKAVAKPEPASD